MPLEAPVTIATLPLRLRDTCGRRLIDAILSLLCAYQCGQTDMIIAMSVLVRPEGLILCLVSFGKVKHIYTNKFLLLAMPASGMSIGVYRALPS
jgi:hypothetical protein